VPRILIIVENLPVPFDRRVWSEATTLRAAGYEVSVICPKGMGAEKSFEIVDGIHIWRHGLPFEARGAAGYFLEYASALFCEFVLSVRVWIARGFDVIQACNPPDLLFIVAGFWKLFFGVRFIFDQHDIGPELYEAKFARRDLFWKLLCWFERKSFALADVSIATNNSYREIAVTRGRMSPDKVFVVRSGPNLSRVREVAPDPQWKNGRTFLVAYVGVIGTQEGLDLLIDSISHIVRERRRSDVQFVILGAGPELDAIRMLARVRGINTFVTFTGRVDDAVLFSALSTADVCVNPDRPNAMNDKSTMNKIMEYMALGKPIVQFNLAEGRFSAQDASLYAGNTDTGDFGDQILELLDDPTRRAAMGEIGRTRVRDLLAWPHEAPKLLAAYAAALNGNDGETETKEPQSANSPATAN
jgi:glycosyltransferase involved in cell wall biosynthesis